MKKINKKSLTSETSPERTVATPSEVENEVENFKGTGLVPVTHAELIPVTPSKNYNKKLEENFKVNGYVWPSMVKTSRYRKKRDVKARISTVALVISFFLFPLLVSVSSAGDFIFLLSLPWLFFTILGLYFGAERFTKTPQKNHWDSATVLWGILNNKEVKLPPGLKSLAEEQLGYAISAAETMDWAYVNKITANDPQRAAAEKELEKSQEVVELVLHATTGADHLRPTPPTVETKDVFEKEISGMKIALAEWEKSLTQNLNIAVNKTNKPAEVRDWWVMVEELGEVKKKARGGTSTIPSEVENLLQKYLPQAELALATLDWVKKYPIKNADPQTVNAKAVLKQTEEVYLIAKQAEAVSEIFNQVVVAEKTRPNQVLTNINATTLSEIIKERDRSLTEWEEIYKN